MDIIRKVDNRHGRIAYEVVGPAWLAEASGPRAAVVPALDLGTTWFEKPRLVSVLSATEATERFGCALAHTYAAGAPHLGAPPLGSEGDGWMGEAHLTLPRYAHNDDSGDRHHASIDVPSDAGHPGCPAHGETARDRVPASYRSWGAFYAREHITPYLYAPAFSASDRTLIERLCEHLEFDALDHGQPCLIADATARTGGVGAARTRDDLWGRDVMWTPEGAVFIDPAAQSGHVEEGPTALAVSGYPHYERILTAYNEVSPLEDGQRERVALHQMHIIMVHYMLFGRPYMSETISTVQRYSQKGIPSHWVRVHDALRMTVIRPTADSVHVDARHKQPIQRRMHDDDISTRVLAYVHVGDTTRV